MRRVLVLSAVGFALAIALAGQGPSRTPGARAPGACRAFAHGQPPPCTPAPGDQRVDSVLLHIPPRPRAPLPLVLAFHGAGGNGTASRSTAGVGDGRRTRLRGPLPERGPRNSEPNHEMGTPTSRRCASCSRKRSRSPAATRRGCSPRACPTAAASRRAWVASSGRGGRPRRGWLPRAGRACASVRRCSRSMARATPSCPTTASPLTAWSRSPLPGRVGGRDGCGRAATSHPRRNVTRLRYTDCDDGLAVEHLRLAGTDHGWPGALSALAPPQPLAPGGQRGDVALLRRQAPGGGPESTTPIASPATTRSGRPSPPSARSAVPPARCPGPRPRGTRGGPWRR